MAKYATLKAAVEAAIKTNGQQQITGQVLQTQLVNMITSLGKYFQSFGGLATPAGSFTAGDESVTFLAVEAGTYSNFGGAVLDGKTLHILAYDGDWADVDTHIPSGAAFEAALALAIKGSQSGIAEGIADTISAGTAQEFLQRQSGGDGVNCIKRIKGKTIAWNQSIVESKSNDYYSFNNGSTIVVIDTPSSFNGGEFRVTNSNTIVGHKYYARIVSDVSAGYFFLKNYYSSLSPLNTVTSQSGGVVVTETAPWELCLGYSGVAAGTYKIAVILVDLTLLGLGDLTAAQFEALCPALYYAPASVLKSNDAAALLTDGRNQWDEEWEKGRWDFTNDGQKIDYANGIRCANYIRVLGNTEYYFRSNEKPYWILWYDADKNFISTAGGGATSPAAYTAPSNAAYMTFCIGSVSVPATTYNNDICINLSDASFNGAYEPYWQRVLALRLSELTGIPEGGTEADRVTMFPNGLGGAGSAFDSLFVENGVTKARKTMTEEIDLGDLSGWTFATIGSYNRFTKGSSGIKASGGGDKKGNLICSKYDIATPNVAYLGNTDKVIGVDGDAPTLYLVDSSLASTDIVDGKIAKLAGVKVIGESAATPIVYTDLQYADGTPFTMPATILVDNGGTERIQAPEGATTPSAPFCCDSNYSIGVANLVKRLAALENAE